MIWLHLSDLCITGDSSWENDVPLKALCRDVLDPSKLSLSGLKRPDLVFVSGNIAAKGQPKDYQEANRFFGHIATVLKVEPTVGWFIVPGERDVTYQGNTPLTHFSKVPTSCSDVNAITKDSSTLAIFTKHQQAYLEFIAGWLGSQRALSLGQPWRVDGLDVEGIKIAVLSLNSVWAAPGLDERRGNLLIGEYQLRWTLDKAEGLHPDLKIALIHHPLSWLRDFEQHKAMALLQGAGGVQLLLRSHWLYEPLTRRETPDSHCLEVASGRFGSDGQRRVIIGNLNRIAGTIEIHVYQYCSEGRGHWAPDNTAYERMAQGCWKCHIPISWNLSIPVAKQASSSATKGQSINYEIMLAPGSDEVTISAVEHLLLTLQKLLGDDRLIITKLEPGSVRLTLTGSEEAFGRLRTAVESGQLKEILGMSILSVQALDQSATLANRQEPTEGGTLWLQTLLYILQRQLLRLSPSVELSQTEQKAELHTVGSQKLAVGWRTVPAFRQSPLAWVTVQNDDPSMALLVAECLAREKELVAWGGDEQRFVTPRAALDEANDSQLEDLFMAVYELNQSRINVNFSPGASLPSTLTQWPTGLHKLVHQSVSDRFNPHHVQELSQLLSIIPMHSVPRALERLEKSERELACDDIALAYVHSRMTRISYAPLEHSLKTVLPDAEAERPQVLRQLAQDVRDLPFAGQGSVLRLGAMPRKEGPWRFLQKQPPALYKVARFLQMGIAAHLRALTNSATSTIPPAVISALHADLPKDPELRSVCERIIQRAP